MSCLAISNGAVNICRVAEQVDDGAPDPTSAVCQTTRYQTRCVTNTRSVPKGNAVSYHHMTRKTVRRWKSPAESRRAPGNTHRAGANDDGKFNTDAVELQCLSGQMSAVYPDAKRCQLCRQLRRWVDRRGILAVVR